VKLMHTVPRQTPIAQYLPFRTDIFRLLIVSFPSPGMENVDDRLPFILLMTRLLSVPLAASADTSDHRGAAINGRSSVTD